MIDLKLIGRKIREMRQMRGLTQGELAEALSVSFQAVSNWERGIAPPDIENLVGIASFFGVLVDTLLSSTGEDLYLGIDGGGTKTEFALVSASGNVYKRIVKSGCNPNDVGFAASEAIICEGIGEIIREHPSVRGIFCGIAGGSTGSYSEKLTASLKRSYPKTKIKVTSDAFNLFSLNDEADLIVISGTGSVVFAKDADGFRRIGGWGHLLDNAGSAYDIGRDAIRHALGEEDRREPLSLLSRMLLKKMNSATVWEHINTLYNEGKPYIAGFTETVFEAYLLKDPAAEKIIERNAKGLADLLNTASKLCKTNQVAVASGGVFEHYSEIMLNLMKKYTDVKLTLCDIPPIYGACRRACAIADTPESDDFYKNFKKSYKDIIK